jgi:3-deoxy-manno-octulosonate cytidylyltransferase (CMP-KDO synthetase)
MATLVAAFQNAKQVADPNIVKVVTDARGRAVYFSRSPIPYDREQKGIGAVNNYLRHLGIYAYRKDFLGVITNLPQGELEKSEKLEQLRVLENGYKIMVRRVEHFCDGIDTPEQYQEFVKRYKRDN